jgi:hypothetical protein
LPDAESILAPTEQGLIMSIFKRISDLFSPSSGIDKNAYWVTVRCKRCGETIRARINLANDLSAEYDGENTTFVCRKILMGENRCFQQIEIVLRFDKNRRVIARAINGGEFVDAEQVG